LLLFEERLQEGLYELLLKPDKQLWTIL